MRLLRSAILLIMSLTVLSFVQTVPSDLTSLKPKYAPDSVLHRNKLDDLGKKWGKWQFYSRNGALILEITYKNNQRNGEFVRYNGITNKMLEKGAYINDLKNGTFTKWFSNGNKRAEGSYRKGLKTGMWSYYYKNTPGIIRINGEFDAGKKDGKWVFYDKNGTIRSVIKYEQGVIVESIQDKK